MRIKAAHVTGSVSSHGGGIALALCSLVNGQEELGIDPVVFAPEDGGTNLPGWPTGQPQTLPARRFGPVLWGEGMRCKLEAGDPDLVHTHGLWGQPSIIASRLRLKEVVRVISPHGMLDPWALGQGRFRKWLAMRLFERRNLASADCLHALCRSEAESIRALGFRNPIAVIPNGVDLPERRGEAEPGDLDKILLFLGRLHPKKGLPNVLHALAGLHRNGGEEHKMKSWQFVIAGWDQGGHEADLKKLCRELELPFASIPADEFMSQKRGGGKSKEGGFASSSPVVFLGSAFGDTKDLLLRRADAFILPSFSEGLPVAVLEAWAYELPVLMTGHCNLPEGFEAKAAVRIDTVAEQVESGSGKSPTAIPIREGLRLLFEMDDDRRTAMGQRGRVLVEDQFTWTQVAAQMKELYEWLLKRGSKPGFVEFYGLNEDGI